MHRPRQEEILVVCHTDRGGSRNIFNQLPASRQHTYEEAVCDYSPARSECSEIVIEKARKAIQNYKEYKSEYTGT